MKVILKSDVEKLGNVGDIKNVALGFARNYLIARGLATEATPAAIAWFEKGKERREKARAKILDTAKETIKKLAEVTLKFDRKVGDGGKLFGSVGKSDIVKGLKKSGYDVEKTSVIMDAALKELGEFDVEIRLATDVSAKIKVSVIAQS
jgi:large subunit ribosomal protein L9